ncbi:MAG: oligosaccharide flippase family protein [Prevotella sp.]|nr:oligosaccharide flippase family protein [Prevotella sp.]
MTARELIQKLKTSDIARRMASGAVWSFTGTALGKFIVLLTGIICARILGKECFGQLGIVRSTIGMFIVLGTGGIGVTATRFIASYRHTDKAHAASIYQLSTRFALFTGIVVTIIMLALSSTMARQILNSPELTLSLQLGCLMLLVSILNGSENGTLLGLEDFRAVAINTFVGSLFESVCMIVGAYFYQLEGAVLGFGIGIVALYVANWISVRRGLHKEGIATKGSSIWKEDWKILYRYSIPATLSALTITPVFWLIRSMLVRSDGYGELAIFEAADQWKVIILFVPGAISQIALPILSSIFDKRKFQGTLLANVLLIAVVSAILALLIGLFSPVIMPLYGQTFSDTLTLSLLAASTVPSAVSNVLEMSIYSRDKMWVCLLMNLIWAVLTVVFAYMFLHMGMGAAALALAVLLSYLAKTAIMGVYMYYLIKKDAS